jgi:ABC-type multidrug transport system ATPase subunit
VTLLEMREFADRRAKGYSQGERLKVAIARALVHAPRNVVLDEATTGLDVMATRALRSLVRPARDSHCVLLSSHVMGSRRLCDDVVIIARGVVVAQGTPEEIRQRSAPPARGCIRQRDRQRRGLMMRALTTVWRKELIENFRDRRTVISALVFGPLFGPFVIRGADRAVAREDGHEFDQKIRLAVAGSAHAPNLVRFLEDHDLAVKAWSSMSGRPVPRFVNRRTDWCC